MDWCYYAPVRTQVTIELLCASRCYQPTTYQNTTLPIICADQLILTVDVDDAPLVLVPVSN